MKYILKCAKLYLVMYMEITQLEYFCSAAELENFTLAARKHFIPQSAMSITIKRLEKELGKPLFNRFGNKVKLNENGSKFYLHAKSCVEEFKNARDSIKNDNEPSGIVRLQVLEERRVMAEIIASFSAKYPKIQFSIIHNRKNSSEQNLHEFDIKVTSAGKQDDDCISVPILSDRLMLAVSNTHRLAGCKRVKVSELQNERFIMMPNESSLSRLTDELCRKNGFAPQKSILCDDPFCLRKYIAAGLGVSFIPLNSWKGLFDHNISFVEIEGISAVRTTMLQCDSDAFADQSVKLFFDYCITAAKEYNSKRRSI